MENDNEITDIRIVKDPDIGNCTAYAKGKQFSGEIIAKGDCEGDAVYNLFNAIYDKLKSLGLNKT